MQQLQTCSEPRFKAHSLLSQQPHKNVLESLRPICLCFLQVQCKMHNSYIRYSKIFKNIGYTCDILSYDPDFKQLDTDACNVHCAGLGGVAKEYLGAVGFGDP